MFQEGLKEQITKAVVLAARQAILFFGWWSHKEGLPLGNARDVGLSLVGPISWASRAAQVAATVNTVQEGHWAIAEVVVERRTKARGPGHPHGMMKETRTPAAAYDVKEWMWGMKEVATKGEVRKGGVVNCRPEQRNTHSPCTGQGRRWHRRQGRPQFPRDYSGSSPSSGGGSSDWEAIEVPDIQP